MKNNAVIEGTLLLVISLFGVAEATRLILVKDPLMVYDVVGPGYYILVLSLALMATAVFHIIVHHKKANSTAKMELAFGLGKRTFGVISILVLYILVIDYLGYLISTIFFFLFEFRITGIKSWLKAIILSIVFTTIYYIVFIKYFNVAFPRGIF